MKVMEDHHASWQSVPEMKEAFDRFVRNLKKIGDHHGVMKTGLEPLKKTRAGSKNELIEAVFPVTSVIGVFADDAADRKLGKLGAMKYSELEKLKAGPLKSYCTRILNRSRALLVHQPVEKAGRTAGKKKAKGKGKPSRPLADYGVTVKHLDRLQQALERFARDDEALGLARKARKTSRKKLDRLVKENNRLLKNKLDRLMHLFRDSGKPFYSAYIRSRTAHPEKTSSQEPVQKKPVQKKPVQEKAAAAKPVSVKPQAEEVPSPPEEAKEGTPEN